MIRNINRLWKHLSRYRHRQFFILLILMFVASLLEIISIGAILPFMAAIAAPEALYQNAFMEPFIQLFNITHYNQLMLPLTIGFVVAAILSGSVRLTLLYYTNKLSFAVGADLSIDVYRRTLYQDYLTHIARNSSEVINSIIIKTQTVTGGVAKPVLTLISSILLLIGILFTLFIINALVAFGAMVTFGVIYGVTIHYTRQKIRKNSECIAIQSTNMIKSLQEGLGGVRDVIIDGSQEFYCKLYRNADLPLRDASSSSSFIKGSPKFAIEAIGISLISILAYILIQQDGAENTTIPTLAALALGAQRLLPALQQAYGAYTSLKGSRSSFEDVLRLLDQTLPSYANQPSPKPITFKKEICLKKVSFRYSKETPWILENVNLRLPKGSRIGFKGPTGSGKSTLIDIVLGLLRPTNGGVFIDNQLIDLDNRRSWQMRLAHVPQNIYLSDSTIEENIAFGMPKEHIDSLLVKEAAKQAHISEYIEGLSIGYKTIIGERGIRLSGGQRQRIGIARALYKKADVLVFDEATSALDNETESVVMKSIENLGKDITILVIAHRLTTLELCDYIVDLESFT